MFSVRSCRSTVSVRHLAPIAFAMLILLFQFMSPAGASSPHLIIWGANDLGQLGTATISTQLGGGDAVEPLPTGPLLHVRAVSAGYQHSLAVKDDGTVWAWGRNDSGQLGNGTRLDQRLPVQVLGAGRVGFLTGVKSVAAGGPLSLALKTDGTVWEWGDFLMTPVEVAGNATQIAVGYDHAVVLESDGKILTWGRNIHGELGDGSYSGTYTPMPVVSLSGGGSLKAVMVAAGYYHSLAVLSDGTVAAWGTNDYGQLGNGTTATAQYVPRRVNGLTHVISVGGGAQFSMAMKDDGTVWSWGNNDGGQLGDGTNVERNSPVQVSGPGGVGFLSGVAQLDLGAGTTLARMNDGTVLTWGWDADYFSENNAVFPIPAVGFNGSGHLTGVTDVSEGDANGMVVLQDGSVLSWGVNTYGEVGIGEFDPSWRLRNSPLQVLDSQTPGLLSASAIGPFKQHIVVVGADGVAYQWGNRASSVPAAVPGPGGVGALSGVSAVASGNVHNLALKSDGTVWAWGDNSFGELGNGAAQSSATPVQVVGPGGVGFLTGVVSIAVGDNQSYAVRNDGSVWSWGKNIAALGIGASPNPYEDVPQQVKGFAGVGYLTGATALAANGGHVLALLSDGSVAAWGANTEGQLGAGIYLDQNVPVHVVGPGDVGILSGVRSIAAGAYHSAAALSDGTVWTWGNNGLGQLGDGTTTSRNYPVRAIGVTGAVQVAAGDEHTLSLKSDGTLMAWGSNDSYQLGYLYYGPGAFFPYPRALLGTTHVVSVAAGLDNTIALLSSTPPPYFQSFDPDVGEFGDGVTITGGGLIDVSSVEFNGVSASFTLSYDGATLVTVVPQGATTGLIKITTSTGVVNSPYNFTVRQGPRVMALSPITGPVGTRVTVTGVSLAGATAVKFNGISASYSVDSDTQITAYVPQGASTGPVSVTTPLNTGSGDNFIVPAAADIAFSPDHGSLGSQISITGSGFAGATAVNFNGAASNYTVNSDSSITATVPYGASTGFIAVTTPTGTGTSASNFTVDIPAITSFTPNNGSVNSTVNITGSAFTAASAVKFNGVGANYVINSDTSITATVPFGATTGPISVTSPAGTGTSAANFTVNPPTITNFSPTSGSIGSFVTLTGSSFTGVTAVKFGSISANFFYSSDTQINATVPPGFVSGLISVITPAGTGDTSALSPSNFTVPGPVITNLNPNNGSPRSTVVITGTGFTSATDVKFNGVSANYYINQDTQIVAFVPDTATTGPVTVTTPSGTSLGVSFTVIPPVLTGLK